jgi:hypothetical protein
LVQRNRCKMSYLGTCSLFFSTYLQNESEELATREGLNLYSLGNPDNKKGGHLYCGLPLLELLFL